jgi:serine/threonine-protein kinase
MSIEPGQRLGPYEVVEAIGAGGMGEVFRATDTRLKRDVALKVLPAAVAGDPDRLARFRREAEVLAALNHPHIAQIYGLEESSDTTALVMELVEGPTLAERIAAGPLQPSEAMAIAHQIIDALEAAHARQIVHRDLKPANVKVRRDGTVKLLDFGIAKAIEVPAGVSGPKSPSLTTPAMTQAGILLGTAAYMSPEQARGKPVDRRADIWAFGCLLYEMLTGQPAFGGEDVPITLARVLAHGTDLKSLPGTISPAVRHTIALCLEKDPRKRIADVADVRLALQGAFESGDRPAAGQAGAAPLWRRVLSLAIAVLIAVAVTALASSMLRKPDPAEVRRFIHRLPPEQTILAPNVPILAIAPDSSSIVYAAAGQLYIRRLDELEGQPIPGTAGEQPIVPVFSPDGEWILYASTADGALKRIAVNGGTPQPVLQTAPQLGWQWPEDDAIYYVNNCTIERLSLTGGEPEDIAEHPGFACPEPVPLRGKYLLYERRVGNELTRADVVVESLDDGTVTPLFPGKQPYFLEPGYLVYYDLTLGLMARAFDPDTLEYSSPVAISTDIAFPVPDAAVHFRISPDGTLAYVRGEASFDASITIVDEEGLIETLAFPPGNYSYPALSPDGSLLALQVSSGDSSDIFVFDLLGDSEPRQLTSDGGSEHPAWSPDGLSITYASNRAGNPAIYRQPADGSGVIELLVAAPENGGHALPAWAPDGRLVYVEITALGQRLLAVDLPDGSPEQLVSGTTIWGYSFSADGSALAYSAGGTGAVDMFVQRYPPAGSPTRISEPGIISLWPTWSRGSNRLTYQTSTAAIVSVDVALPGFAVRNRRDLAVSGDPTQRQMAAMPGGNRLLLTSQATGTSSGFAAGEVEIVIVEHWVEDLNALVPDL